MKKWFVALIAVLLIGCASPVAIPENVSGVFCNYVETLTAKITTVVTSADVGSVETSQNCNTLIQK